MKWIKIFDRGVWNKSDFIEKITADGRKICVVKQNDNLFAVHSRCPHAGADLSQGWCVNGNIVCPYHRHEFDLKTGKGKAGQGNYINTYPLESRDDGVYVGLVDKWWKFW